MLIRRNMILYRLKVARRIKSIHICFDNLFKWAKDLGLEPLAHLSSLVQSGENRNTPPFEEESLIVGRENDIKCLVQMVCKEYEEDLPLIAVVGMGGQGKTTLSRMVYNRNVVIDMFSKRMWVTVSDDFDFMKILNQMVVSLTSNSSVLDNTEGLIKNLETHLKGQKFLLVLDDVWNENSEEWDNLRNSLLGINGARGSIILITTRKQEVIDAMRYSVSYRVEKLSEEDSWTLFKQRAFSRGGVSENEEFAALGKRMVERCGGLPLAIKTLGGLLHSKKSEEEWLLIHNSETWKSKGILSSLRLSYDNLPYSSLKRCFVYCSSMPKDSIIYKSELVQIWMALGFLVPPKGSNALMEDIGNEYFNILLWNSLLQDAESNEFGDIYCCKMHDLVHDLAQDLSKHYIVTVKTGQELNHFSKPVILRVDTEVSDIKLKAYKRNFERVQMLYTGDRILSDLLPYIKHLTVLVLTTTKVSNELPSSLRKMKYLKHLDISCSNYRLPNYITELYNLQTLRVLALQELPQKFCNLINLRHLYIVNEYERFMFIGIERLTCLQTLPHFVVGRDQNCLVGQLGALKNLRGKLHLYNLSDVSNWEEANKAELCRKSNIKHLLLDWSNNSDEREVREYNDYDVMEGLRPHMYLKRLTIFNFKGAKIASWITLMTNLVKITIKNCKRCEELPPMGHLPKLSEMEIDRMDSLKYIESEIYEFSDSRAAKTVEAMYPSLTKLTLWELPKLEEWLGPVMSTGKEDPSTKLVFPKLEILTIWSCPKFSKIPSSLMSFLKLNRLEIVDLDSSMILETMSTKVSTLVNLRLWNASGAGGSSSSGAGGSCSSSYMTSTDELIRNNSSSLKILRLRGCDGLTCLTIGPTLEGLEVSNCPSLTSINVLEESTAIKSLRIQRCHSLKEWTFVQSMRSTLVKLTFGPFWEELDEYPWPFSSSVLSFPNTISLTLHGWEKIKTMPPAWEHDDHLSTTFPALTELYIIDFKGVKSLPDSVAKLPSLKELHIMKCENLTSLPTFEKCNSLESLTLSECPDLKERCKKESGPEWFKIQHIPHIKW